jgi:adenylate cyclase class IV
MFIAAPFIIDKLWTQPRCSTIDWIKKMRYIYTMQHYFTIRKKELTPFAGKWIELEIMLSQVNQDQKQKYSMF